MKNFKYIFAFISILALGACEDFTKKVDEYDPTQPRNADLDW